MTREQPIESLPVAGACCCEQALGQHAHIPAKACKSASSHRFLVRSLFMANIHRLLEEPVGGSYDAAPLGIAPQPLKQETCHGKPSSPATRSAEQEVGIGPGARTKGPDNASSVSNQRGGHLSPAAFRD
jgi:hypothetical protein